MPEYRVLRGLDYPPGRRAEPGDTVDDLPKGSVKALLARGHIEPINKTSPPNKADEGGED